MDFIFHRSYRGKVKAVIFDWAGTTVDYGCFAPALVFNEVFQKRGITITIEQAREPMGLAKKDHIRAITQMESVEKQWEDANGTIPTEEDVEAMYREFIPLQLDCLAKYSTLVPGAKEILSKLRNQNIKVGSSTGYNREMLEICMREGKRQGFAPESNVCAEDLAAGRPAPFMCLQNMMNLDVYPVEACVKVGDTPADVYEGLNAGMWTVGTAMSGNQLGLSLEDVQAMSPQQLQPKRERAYQCLAQSGAHFVIDTIADLQGVLDTIHQRLVRGERP